MSPLVVVAQQLEGLLGHLAGLVHAAERHRGLAEPHRDQRALVDELPRDGPRQGLLEQEVRVAGPVGQDVGRPERGGDPREPQRGFGRPGDGDRGLDDLDRPSPDLDRVKVAAASIPSDVINYVNGQRPFTTMYVINFASWATVEMHDLIHELTHVWQGVQTGPLYMVRALEAQISAGVSSLFHTGKYDDSASYDVFAADLAAANGDFGRFNPEQQATIVERYWMMQYGGYSFSTSVYGDVTQYQVYAARVKTARRPGAAAKARRRPAARRQAA